MKRQSPIALSDAPCLPSVGGWPANAKFRARWLANAESWEGLANRPADPMTGFPDRRWREFAAACAKSCRKHIQEIDTILQS